MSSDIIPYNTSCNCSHMLLHCPREKKGKRLEKIEKKKRDIRVPSIL